jgi:hypothetical protein
MTKPRKAGTAKLVNDDAPVTAENYVAKACAFIRAKGQGVVIRTNAPASPPPASVASFPPDEAKWRAWMTYLAKLGVRTAYARHVGYMTVPADWPEAFDPAAPQSDPFPPPLPAKEPAIHSAWIGPALAQLARNMAAMPLRQDKPENDARFARTPEQRAKLVAEAEAKLEALKAQNIANPVAAPGHAFRQPEQDDGAIYPGEFDIPFDGA